MEVDLHFCCVSIGIPCRRATLIAWNKEPGYQNEHAKLMLLVLSIEFLSLINLQIRDVTEINRNEKQLITFSVFIVDGFGGLFRKTVTVSQSLIISRLV